MTEPIATSPDEGSPADNPHRQTVPDPRGLTGADVAAVARRGLLALVADPAMRHYSTDTLALIYRRTILGLCGAGDLDRAAELIAADPELAAIPDRVLGPVMAASFEHFAAAFDPAPADVPPTTGGTT